MAAAGEGDDGGKSGFRCLDAARYVSAAMVIVLIAAVVVYAIKVVIRPDEISVSVVGNSVITEMIPPPPENLLSFEFTLRAVNPSGRGRIYFYNITAYIFDNSTAASTSSPSDDCSIFVVIANITLPPTQYVDNNKRMILNDNPKTIKHSFFDALYKRGGRVSGATMRVDGSLVTEIRLGINTTAKRITLYCRELVVGPMDKVLMSSQGTACTKS